MENLTYITEDQVKKLLSWEEVFTAVEVAFRSVSDAPEERKAEEPNSSQPARSFTWGANKSGVLFSMPGCIGNYKLPIMTQDQVHNSLGCKLVTSFQGNQSREPSLPTIMATIVLMNPHTGQLQSIVEGTEITKWRTAAASLVATHSLYFNRPDIVKTMEEPRILSIVGCGVQGEIHAIGFVSLFSQFKEIRLYNRTTGRRDELYDKLNSIRPQFKNYDLIITKSDSVTSCVKDADVIVTVTHATVPLIKLENLKPNCHINAVGAGPHNHYTELHPDVYDNCQLYPDNWESSRSELSGIFDKITGIVGEVLQGVKSQPTKGITVFQSMGMAVEDVVVAQMLVDKYKKALKPAQSLGIN